MTTLTQKGMETEETRLVEKALTEAGFRYSEAYRHHSASIRVRVIDERFRGLSRLARMELIEPVLEKLPEETQRDIIFCLPITEDERQSLDFGLMNREFESPRPSQL